MTKSTKPPTLREWLELKGKTQTWLAGELGISNSFMSELLSGQRSPSLKLAVRIEELTGIPARELVAA